VFKISPEEIIVENNHNIKEIDREEFIEYLKKYLKRDQEIFHSYAEAIKNNIEQTFLLKDNFYEIYESILYNLSLLARAKTEEELYFGKDETTGDLVVARKDPLNPKYRLWGNCNKEEIFDPIFR